MDEVEELIKDPSVKGMWCVPKYSNPTGETYSDATVKRIAAMRPAAPDFRVFWDLAYVIHDLDDTPDQLLNIFELTKGTENEDLVYAFFSTSKITYPGAGIAVMVSSDANIKHAKADIAFQTISPDKINQLRHMKYLKNAETVRELMKKHAAILKPKFDACVRLFEEKLGGTGLATWTNPHGGYFISLDVMEGTAKRVCALCKEAGVTLTGAGATFPYKNDPADKNIRIAPSYPTLAELVKAMEVVCLCVKLAAAEKLTER
jgi:DNA-binding transcriptional MocR family regulator